VSDSIISLYRARLAREKGTIGKDWGGRVSIALVYPNHYRVGMSNLGFQVVYALFNRIDSVVAERAFLPDDQEMSLYDETGRGLLSLESQSPLQRFDIVAFSVSFENDYPNILNILRLGKIPLLSEDRDSAHPFIMAGGIATFLNPEPLAPFFDFFLMGEAEANLGSFIALFTDICKTTAGRKDTLRALAANLKSLYVPSFYHVEYDGNGTIRSMEPTEDGIPERIEAPYQELSGLPVNSSAVLTPETEFADRVLIETGRGCGHACRFCGWIQPPLPSRGRHGGLDAYRTLGRLPVGYPGNRESDRSDTGERRTLFAFFLKGRFPDARTSRSSESSGSEDRDSGRRGGFRKTPKGH